jgi:N12 class adenine-specific DNA methylase
MNSREIQHFPQIAQENFQTPENWMTFLELSSWHYKHTFYNQMLIVFQRPDATAVTGIEAWNKKLNRTVNVGAKRILVLDDQLKYEFKNVFDVSDTHKRNPNGPDFKLWNLENVDEVEIIKRATEQYQETRSKHTLPYYIMTEMKVRNKDQFEYFKAEIMESNRLYLRNLDVSDFATLYDNSVIYQILSRCGYNPRDYFNPEDFAQIKNIKNFKSLIFLGNNITNTTKPFLIEMGKLLQTIEMEQLKNQIEGELKNEQEPGNIQTYGIDLSPGRGVSDPGYQTPDSTQSGNREVRELKEPVSEGIQAGSVDGTDLRRQDQRTPGGSGSGSQAPTGADLGGDDEKSSGPGQENPAPGMGGSYEQPSEPGQRDRSFGTHLQLSLFKPEQESIKPNQQAESLKPSAFSMPQHDIDVILRSAGNNKNSQLRIVAQYKKQLPAEDNVVFLQAEYRTGGKGFYIDEKEVAVWFDKNGIQIARGNTVQSNFMKTTLSWEQVEKRIGELLENGLYMGQEQLDQVDGHERKELANKLWYLHQDRAGEFFMEDEIFQGGFPDSSKRIAELYTDPDKLDEIINGLDGFAQRYKQDRFIMRFHLHKPDELLNRLRDLKRERRDYQANGFDDQEPAMFITEDEVDAVLGSGSSASSEKQPIINYFSENHSHQEKADFLKDIYGTKSQSRGLSGADHSWLDYSAKGILLRREEAQKSILLSWPKVAQRIDELMAQGRYVIDEAKRIEAPELKPEKPAIPLADIHDLLINMTPDDYTRPVIYDLLSETKNNDEFGEVIKNTYLFSEVPVLGNLTDTYRQHLDQTGIRFEKTADPSIDYFLSWSEIAGEVRQLIEAGQYVVPGAYQEMDPEPFVESYGETRSFISFDRDPEDAKDRELIDVSAADQDEGDHSDQKKTEINTPKPENYKITADVLGEGSPRQKFKANVLAIQTLQVIEKEKRMATPDEQAILSRYVGWGGLPQAFDSDNIHWKPEVQELKGLLTEEEYSSAKGSTLNAHYTAPVIIKAMYGALEQMGYNKGNILEPGMGVGHFFGLLPDAMKDSKLYGVELDEITGRIAKALYPEADISVCGFEKTQFSNNFFDVAIGNVPFGDYQVYDKLYDKHSFMIHDYFFAKSLDKVRDGGVIAFITSKGTLDKKTPMVRKYLAERAELIGAVRLPNNAFKENAGTEVTSDIIFLKKRDRMVLAADEPWVHLGMDENGIPMNQYFIDHPEMILGEMQMVSGRFGEESACLPIPGNDLQHELVNALGNLDYQFPQVEIDDEMLEEDDRISIPADPNVANYSYTIVDDELYYRENSQMKRMDKPAATTSRIMGLIGLRDCTRELIALQLENGSNGEIEKKQEELHILYDAFAIKHGLINATGNRRAFDEDGSYWLLCALEVLNEDGTFREKSDIFYKRTIRTNEVVTAVDTSNEALLVSISEKAKVDLDYMSSLTGKSTDVIISDLEGLIFRDFGNLDPEQLQNSFDAQEIPFVTADEYLSGNVRKKLDHVRQLSEILPKNQAEILLSNINALEAAQPRDLEASEIEVRLGATWIEPDYIQDFMVDTFKPATFLVNSESIKIHYSPYTGVWNVQGKNADTYDNVLANVTYGTKRANAYRILEDSLNLKDIRIYDTTQNADGNDVRVLNKNETILASQKQELIKEAFRDWVFKDQQRREVLTQKYNILFNSVRPREYEGSHVVLHGISPEISLRDYQLNAIARALYGGNTLLGHCVGAGKTFEMTAIAMESKYLGLSNKSLFVVPNHLIGQWGAEFLALYPGANVLVARKKDFEPNNRKKFCSRIATGDYDAVIIGHSQFEKIPLSKAFQEQALDNQIDDVLLAIDDAKRNNEEQFTIKQLEKTRKSLEAHLNRLNDGTRKDEVITFEELGIDRLFVDEAHNYKNLFLYTKMRNVAGIGQSEAQKATDMFNKCQYLDQLTQNKGVVFATGTPISNSITELYTMMRYLQYDTLMDMNLGHFDAWASTFAEAITAIELSPEGTGYRSKTRLARFYNLPELMAVFKEVADIQTPDMLKLPVPKAIYEDVVIKPSDHQKDMLMELVDRADRVRKNLVEPYEDNMLKITNDGRKLALDQRLISPLLPDPEESKVNKSVENIVAVWQDSMDQRSAQLVFCDLSTPNKDGRFNVYQEIKNKAIEKGIPEDEIAFIHDADTDVKKTALFSKVRSGSVRVLIGSTPKMGAGTNVQDKLIALHHLDVPWRPSDIEQQEGLILRQGNENPEVKIFRYITEQTFDSYSWQLIENKQKFIGQIMTSKLPGRSCEDVDEQALSYAEVKALATGNPLIKEKMDLDVKVTKLKLIKANFVSQRYRLEDNILKAYPRAISIQTEQKNALIEDLKLFESKRPSKDYFEMTIGNVFHTDKKEAGTAILEVIKKLKDDKPRLIGQYAGFKMAAKYAGFDGVDLLLKNQATHTVHLGTDPLGNITRIGHVLESIPDQIKKCEMNIQDTMERLENARDEVKKPFPQEQELNDYLLRLNELNTILSVEQSEHSQGTPDNGASMAEHLEDMEMFAIDEGEWEPEQ